MTLAETIACRMLDCDELHLKLLDEVGYDVCEIIDGLIEDDIRPKFNIVITDIFLKGIDDIRDLIQTRLEEIKFELEYYEDDGDRSDEFDENADEDTKKFYELLHEQEALKTLDPYHDIHYYRNYLDSSIWIQHNKEIYEKYLLNELKEVEELMGFSIHR